jgi:hypothetical protein
MILRRNKGRLAAPPSGYRSVNHSRLSWTRTRRLASREEGGDMMALIASQLLGFILGGGAFLLRHDRGDFTTLPW